MFSTLLHQRTRLNLRTDRVTLAGAEKVIMLAVSSLSVVSLVSLEALTSPVASAAELSSSRTVACEDDLPDRLDSLLRLSARTWLAFHLIILMRLPAEEGRAIGAPRTCAELLKSRSHQNTSRLITTAIVKEWVICPWVREQALQCQYPCESQ